MKSIYDLKLHETTEEVREASGGKLWLTVLRVPGGWVYYFGDTSGVFVPEPKVKIDG